MSDDKRSPCADTACGFVPFPGSPAYGHWTCQRRRHHLGRHRFRNYTIARIPRVWHVRRLWSTFKTDRRLRRFGSAYSYRRALYPTKWEPARSDGYPAT